MVYEGEQSHNDSDSDIRMVEKGDRFKLEGHNFFNERNYSEANLSFLKAEKIYNEALISETDPLKRERVNKMLTRIREKLSEIDKYLLLKNNQHSVPVFSNYCSGNNFENPDNSPDLGDQPDQGDPNKESTPSISVGN